MPKNAKKPIKGKLVKKLDIVFSRWVRMSNADHRGFCECVTCGKKEHWKQIQAGHFMSRRHYSTRWDEDNVKPQCKACNVFNQGRQYEYSIYLGKDLSDDLLAKSRQTIKFSAYDIQQMIDIYEVRIKKMSIFE
tara:strand:- start:3547 stop:3948 length:402 start_codon:yes stop_codon:yes gene_type:complete